MQQINLYLPEFQPNREPLRSIHMLWGLGVFIVVLGIVSSLSASANRQSAATLIDSRQQLEQLKAQVALLEGQRPSANLAQLDAQILTAGQELNRREQIFSIIANKDIGNNVGFSAHLQALGRQSLDTISLSVFSLYKGGKYAEFAGKTRAADQIPLYIQRLRTEAAFSQSAFGVLNIETGKNAQGPFQFSLAKQTALPVAQTNATTAVQRLLEQEENARGAQ
jgi:hypothetical protein